MSGGEGVLMTELTLQDQNICVTNMQKIIYLAINIEYNKLISQFKTN